MLWISRLKAVTVVQLMSIDVNHYYERSQVYADIFSDVFILLTPAVVFLTIFLLSFKNLKLTVKNMELKFHKMPDYVFWGLIPAVSVCANAWIAHNVIGATPRVFDGFNYWFQAKNISLGHFYSPAPPLPELFRFPFIIIKNSKWYGSVYPGFPLLLAPGVKFGIGWLVNPFLGGVTLSALFFMAKEILGKKLSKLLVILGLISPFFRMMNSIFMSHAAAILWITIATWMLWRWAERKNKVNLWTPFIAGIALGWIYLTRPQAGAVSMPAILIWSAFRVRWCGWRRLVVFIFPLLCAAVFLGVYNYQLTGDCLTNPRYFVDPGRSLGFGDDLGEPLPGGARSGHDWSRGFKNAGILVNLWNSEMFGWGSSGLVGWPLFLVLLVITRCYRKPETWIFFMSIFLNVFLYVFYFTPSPNFGPRYLAGIIPSTLVLSSMGFRELHRLIFKRHEVQYCHAGISILLLCLFLVTLLIAIPLQSIHYGILPPCLNREEIAEPSTPSIILIPPDLQCMNTFIWNSPALNGNIFLPQVDDEILKKLSSNFPGRSVYLLGTESGDSKKLTVKRLELK